VAQRAKNKPELKIVVSNTPEVPAVEPVPEQVEMPFAIVNGEPVTQMPKDLYIPPQAMEVFLEAFEGPLDLLLYLIRRQNLNILDIPLAEITRQYMQYIEVMTELQLELAGEYMVMAATLAEIKSRMLLPRPKADPQGNEEDPRAELVRRLQEYERFKRAAEDIDSLHRLERDVWQTSAELKDRKVVRLLPTVTLQEMLLAFKDVVVRSEMFAHHHIQRERLSVRERMTNVMTMLENASFVEFVRLFQVEEGRMGVTVTFMAILELVREGLIEIVQAEPFAPIHVRAAGASRKLHVVGGSEALVGEGVVVGEAVVGDAPAIGVIAAPADLESITELVLDPDFVDDDDDEEEGFLEGVDDDVNEPVPPPAPVSEVALADAGSTPPAVEPTSVVDEWTAAIEPFALVEAAADVVAGPAPVLAEAADVTFAPTFDPALSLAADSESQFATDVVAASLESALADVPPAHLAPGDKWAANADPGESAAVTFEPAASHEVAAVVDLASSPVAIEPVLAADVVGAAVESVLVAESADIAFTPAVDFAPSTAVDSETQFATDVVAASVESAPADVPPAHLAPGDEWAASVDLGQSAAVTFEPAAVSHEVGAVVDLGSSPVAIEPVLAADVVGAAVDSVLADVPVPVEAGAVVELAAVDGPATAELPEAVVDLDAAQVDVPASTYELASAAPAANELSAVDVQSPLIDEPSVSSGPAGGEIAVSLEPYLTDLTVEADETSLGADVAPAADPAPAVDESAVTVDPAVFDAPAVTAESEPPSGTSPEEEPPTPDVEYEVSADDLAAAEQAASDDGVSLVGDTSVAGDVSLVGEESVSGGPAVEVEEFAFDELPALDEAEHADQQPAAGAQTEESDD
jgi:segregation and condensation protein A